MPGILVVDDDAAGLEIRKLILERRGFSVTIASDADQARAAFSPNVDAVILDLRLPRVEDGLALIREFRAASASLRIVVLCGNRADLDRREEAFLVNEIVPKPARAEVLLSAIARRL